MCLACGSLFTLPADAKFPIRVDFRRMLERFVALLNARPIEKPAKVLGISVPDTDASNAAFSMILAARSPLLVNHSLRTFALGMTDARRHDFDIDQEAAFIASMLHDIALLPREGEDLDKTFEETSADLARVLAKAHRFSDARSENIAQAILLHAGQAPPDKPDIAFVMVGARQDVFGPNREELSDMDLKELERQVPRLHFRRSFLAVMRDYVSRTRNPGWTSDFVENPPRRFLENRWSE